jgi:prepilin-type N-terminal cleavage/methylation domain-containing protein
MRKISNAGFTLIELLVVVTLVGLMGIIITQIFILGLRSQAKNQVMKDVRQNGDLIVSVIEGMVKNAVDITEVGCGTSSKQLTITNQDGFSTVFDCSDNTNMSSVSAYPDPSPTVSVKLNTTAVKIESCNFRLICPTPPINPKYVFVNFNVVQSGPTPLPENRASLEYQTTVSLGNYQ